MVEKKTRILYQLPGILNPIDSGSKQRITGMLEYFRARRDLFEIDVISMNPYEGEVWNELQRDSLNSYFNNIYIYQGQENLVDFAEARIKSLWFQKILRSQLPIDSSYHTPSGYRKFNSNLLAAKNYDYMWLNYLDFWHLIDSEEAEGIGKIIDIHDISCRIRVARKNIAHLRGLKFDYETNFQRETAVLKKFDQVLVNSLDEFAELEPHLGQDQMTLIPHLLAELPDLNRIPDYEQRSMQYDLLFVGTAYEPNIEGMNFFLSEVFPKIIDRCPTGRLAIVGNICNALNIPESLRNHVVCLGFVPDLAEVYLASRVVICPLLSGSGTKVKLQEAMAYGVPIVTTTVGASGLSFVNGLNAYIQDDPDNLAISSIKLMKSMHVSERFSTNLRRIFEEEYSREVVYKRLDRIFSVRKSLVNI
jgi:glycosyltransferase involved in cell wall biosynthesis